MPRPRPHNARQALTAAPALATPTPPPPTPTPAQILGEQHADLFELLGRTSGKDVDKLAELAKRGFGVSRRPADGIPLLVRWLPAAGREWLG